MDSITCKLDIKSVPTGRARQSAHYSRFGRNPALGGDFRLKSRPLYIDRTETGQAPSLPVGVVRRVIVLSDLIALAINNENHAYRHECGRNDKDQNATFQCLNHPSAGGGSLRIAERATLGEGRERGGEHGQSNQRN